MPAQGTRTLQSVTERQFPTLENQPSLDQHLRTDPRVDDRRTETNARGTQSAHRVTKVKAHLQHIFNTSQHILEARKHTTETYPAIDPRKIPDPRMALSQDMQFSSCGQARWAQRRETIKAGESFRGKAEMEDKTGGTTFPHVHACQGHHVNGVFTGSLRLCARK